MKKQLLQQIIAAVNAYYQDKGMDVPATDMMLQLSEDETNLSKKLAEYLILKKKDDGALYQAIMKIIHNAFEEKTNGVDLLTASVQQLSDIFYLAHLINHMPADAAYLKEKIKVQMTIAVVEALAKNQDTLASKMNVPENNLYTKHFPLLNECNTPTMYNSYLLANTLRHLVSIASHGVQDEFYQEVKKQIVGANTYNFKNIHPHLVFKSILNAIQQMPNAASADFLSELKWLCTAFGLPQQMLAAAFTGQSLHYADFQAALLQNNTVNENSHQPAPILLPLVSDQTAASVQIVNTVDLEADMKNRREQTQTKNGAFITAIIKGYQGYMSEKSQEQFYQFQKAAEAKKNEMKKKWSSFIGSSSSSSSTAGDVGLSGKKNLLVIAINPNGLEYGDLTVKHLDEPQKFAVVLELFKYVMMRHGDAKEDRLYKNIIPQLASGGEYVCASKEDFDKLALEIKQYLIQDLSKPMKNLHAYLERLVTLLKHFPDIKVEALFDDPQFSSALLKNQILPYLSTTSSTVDESLLPLLTTVIPEIETNKEERLRIGSLMETFKQAAKAPWLSGDPAEIACKQLIKKYHTLEGKQAIRSRMVLTLLTAIDYSFASYVTAQQDSAFNQALKTIFVGLKDEKVLSDYLKKYEKHFIEQIEESLKKLVSRSYTRKQYQSMAELLTSFENITKAPLKTQLSNESKTIYEAIFNKASKAKVAVEPKKENPQPVKKEKEHEIDGEDDFVVVDEISREEKEADRVYNIPQRKQKKANNNDDIELPVIGNSNNNNVIVEQARAVTPQKANNNDIELPVMGNSNSNNVIVEQPRAVTPPASNDNSSYNVPGQRQTMGLNQWKIYQNQGRNEVVSEGKELVTLALIDGSSFTK